MSNPSIELLDELRKEHGPKLNLIWGAASLLKDQVAVADEKLVLAEWGNGERYFRNHWYAELVLDEQELAIQFTAGRVGKPVKERHPLDTPEAIGALGYIEAEELHDQLEAVVGRPLE